MEGSRRRRQASGRRVQGAGGRRRRARGGSGTGARILSAIPAIAFAIFIVAEGGLVFAIGAGAVFVIGQGELYQMMIRARPIGIAGFVTVIGMVLAALYGDQFQILLILALSFPLTFFLAVLRPRRQDVSWGIAVTMFGILWLGIPLSHAVLLRELPHGGALVVDVLIGTFIQDTAAYFGGRAWGRRPLAPQISPNKTLEGLVTGVIGGTFAFWLFAVAYQHEWFKGPDALLIGFCVAAVAPLGDLFESLVKRDLEIKDTGRFFGPHGGVLDRIDGLLFSAVAGYYVSLAVLG